MRCVSRQAYSPRGADAQGDEFLFVRSELHRFPKVGREILDGDGDVAGVFEILRRIEVHPLLGFAEPDGADHHFQDDPCLRSPPPLGTGEKFEATQKATFRGMKDDFAILGVVTALKTPVDDAALMPAIAPMLWEGDVYINAKTGQYHGAKLAIKKEIANHQGEGTKFRYTSDYTEALEK